MIESGDGLLELGVKYAPISHDNRIEDRRVASLKREASRYATQAMLLTYSIRRSAGS